MDALTPPRRALRTRVADGLGFTALELPLNTVQVSLLNMLNLPVIPSPTTLCRPQSFGLVLLRGLPRYTVFKPSASLARPSASWASPIASRLATTTGRIEFEIAFPTD